MSNVRYKTFDFKEWIFCDVPRKMLDAGPKSQFQIHTYSLYVTCNTVCYNKIISDVLKVSTTNYSRDIRNEMGIRTSTRKTTKLNKQMNKKGNDLEKCQFSE